MGWKFTEWYAKNKTKLAAARKNRYDTDPAYRQQVLERSRTRRQNAKASEVLTGLSANDVCTALGVTNWTLNRWRQQEYFPCTTLRSTRFTEHQVALLQLIKNWLDSHPNRAAGAHRAELDNLVLVVHHNWEGE